MPSLPNNIIVWGTQNYCMGNRKLKTAAKIILQELRRWERRKGLEELTKRQRLEQRGDANPRVEDGRLTPLNATSGAHRARRLLTSHPEQINPPHSKLRATWGSLGQLHPIALPPPRHPQTRPDPDQRRPAEGWKGRGAPTPVFSAGTGQGREKALPQAGPRPRSLTLALALPTLGCSRMAPPLRLPQAPPRPRSQIEALALARPTRPRTLP